MGTARTTISCRAFGLLPLLIGLLAGPAAGADKLQPPRLPIAQRWSVTLVNAAASAPVADDKRIYVSLRSGYIGAYDLADGRGAWLREIAASVPLAAGDDALYVAAGDAVQALRGSDGATAWMVPRIKAAAPLVASGDWVIAVTDVEVVALHAKDGAIAWRHPAGGVHLKPALDADRVYIGAGDGRILALNLADGGVAWQYFLPLGVTAIAARNGRVYAGAGDKIFYCLDGRRGSRQWAWHTGALVTGRISVDDDRVYFSALNNVVWALDRSNGNQRWQTPLHQRPLGGVFASGHVIFVPATGTQLLMLYDRDGRASGTLQLPADAVADIPPDVRETREGLNVVVVSGGLTNEWHLTYFGPAGEGLAVPFGQMEALPGLPYLTDPRLEPLGRVLQALLLADPMLQPLSTITWPVMLTDPPLQPLTALPGLQLRPLSPVLPVRRED